MSDTSGFYKIDLVNGGLLYAQNFVFGPGISLHKDDYKKSDDSKGKDKGEKDKEKISQGGWKWFDSEAEAYTEYNITPTTQPWTITSVQLRIALSNDKLLQQVESVIASADDITKIAWEYTSVFTRVSPTILAIQKTLNWTDEQIDNLFTAASKIVV